MVQLIAPKGGGGVAGFDPRPGVNLNHTLTHLYTCVNTSQPYPSLDEPTVYCAVVLTVESEISSRITVNSPL